MKIANKISLSFLAVAIILTVSAVSVIYVVMKQTMQETTAALLNTNVQLRARHVETFLEIQRNSIIQLSRSIVLKDFLAVDRNDANYNKYYENIIERLKTTEKTLKTVSKICILNLEGKIVASSDKEKIGEDASDFRDSLSGRLKAYLYNSYFPVTIKDESIVIPVPVVDESAKKLLGILVVRVDLAPLMRIVTDREGLGETGESYLLNEYGHMITPSKFMKRDFKRSEVITKNMKYVFSGIEETCELGHKAQVLSYENYWGEKVLGVHDHIRGVNWLIIVEVRETEVMAPLIRLKFILLFILILTPLSAWLLGQVVAGYITRPIVKLREKVKAIGPGNYNYIRAVYSKDEVGDLAESFAKMTERLRETTVSKDYVDNVIANITDILIVLTPDGKISSDNKATFDYLGYSENELIGKDVSILFSEDDGALLKGKRLEKLIKDGKLIDYETNFLTKAGSKIPVLLSGAVVKNKNKEITDIVCIAKDMTERKKMDDKVKKSNQEIQRNEIALKNILYDMKKNHDELKNAQKQLIQSEKLASIGQLSAGIAHEINNPLGFIISNISTLDKYIGGLSEVLRASETLKMAVKEKNIEKAERIQAEITALEEKLDVRYILSDVDNLLRESREGLDRIKKIVMDLKTFSRKDERVMALEDLNKVLDGILNIVWNEIKYTAELRKEYGDIPSVQCNSQQIGQVFINLLVNATQAIEEKGVITIRTYSENKKVYVEISDTGKGMAKDVVTRIFDPFFTTKKTGVGTGLGLSISYDIIKAHNGEIVVESEEGKGTKFTVILPV